MSNSGHQDLATFMAMEFNQTHPHLTQSITFSDAPTLCLFDQAPRVSFLSANRGLLVYRQTAVLCCPFVA